MEPAVVVRDLHKTYLPSPKWLSFLLRSGISAPVVALDGISLAVNSGEICAIVGPNGAGKSTLFRVLTGLTTPTSGDVRVSGIDCTTAPQTVRARIGFVPAGDQTLNLRLTCVDNLMFHGQLSGLTGHTLTRRIATVLETVGIDHAADQIGFTLSSGMRARLQLARAILHRPQVLILDEPTAAVDPVGSYELLQVVDTIVAADNVAVLLSSHRLEEIEALGKRIILMDHGLIAYDGPLTSIPRAQTQRHLTLTFSHLTSRQLAADRLVRVAGIHISTDPGASSTELTVLDNDLSIAQVLNSLSTHVDDLVKIEEVQPTLRDLIYGLLVAPTETVEEST